jgi:hypothetical protein
MSFQMFFHSFIGTRFGMNSDVVHVHREPALCHLLPEYCIHHGLKSGGGIRESKEHDRGLKEPFMCEEGGFPFIALFDTDVVIAPADIECGEQGTTAETINDLGNKGRHVAVRAGFVMTMLLTTII